MNLGINLSLLIGPLIPIPAPAILMEAIQSISVTQQDRGASTFQISLNADRPGILLPDYPLLMSQMIKANNRVIISVIVNSLPTVLIDGFITNIEFNHSDSSGSGTLSVTGEDVTSRMNLKEIPFAFPGMDVEAIIELVIEKYVEYGVVAEVIPPADPLAWEPEEHTRIQSGTDLDTINYYADLLGYIFRVRPTVPLENTAYFGPPTTMNSVMAPLTMNMGPGSNVDDVNLTYDATLPETINGELQDNGLEEEVLPVETVDAIPLMPMAVEDPILFNEPYTRSVLFKDPTNGSVSGELLAEMATSRSIDRVLAGQITVDTMRFGFVIDTPSKVALRGAGFSMDGQYYVNQVTHDISEGKYQQQLSVQREGYGSLLINAMENFV